MYWYAYRRCKKKHAIIEDFDTDKDFVTKDEGFSLETSPLGAGRTNKRVRPITINEDETDLAGVLASPDAFLLKDIASYLEEVFPLCHISDVLSFAEPIGDLDDQGNALERIEELEPLSANLDPITHIDDLEEWTKVIVLSIFFFCKNFDTDKDFVTEDEGFALETSPLGAGRTDKRVRPITIDDDGTDLARVSASPNASLRKDIAPS